MQGNTLVTDDDSGLRRALSNTFDSSEFDVREAADGEHARSEIWRDRFDVVLLDMPGMGGIAACREMRKLFPLLQIIMLSVREREKDKMDALMCYSPGVDPFEHGFKKCLFHGNFGLLS